MKWHERKKRGINLIHAAEFAVKHGNLPEPLWRSRGSMFRHNKTPRRKHR